MTKVLIIILPAMCLLACRKEKTRISVQPVGSSVSVIIDQSQPGYKIPDTFEGLSFETKVLTADAGFLNEKNVVLVQLIKNLGPGILRIGGGTSDEVYWSANPLTASPDSLSATQIDRLSSFAKAINWQVLFGLNLGDNDADAALSEAVYASTSLGNNLYAFQSGNEPDVFYLGFRPPTYTYMDYQQDWERYFNTINERMPDVAFAGPDVAYNSSWITSFAQNEHDKIKLLDGHFYTDGPATESYITYHTILGDNSKLINYLQIIESSSAKFKLPYRISETNNIWGGGKKGVSNTFASALWALDTMWAIAENKGSGVNFHDGDSLYYSPVTNNNGVMVAAPEYYAMLAFEYAAGGGTIIPAVIDKPEFCRAYACVKADNSLAITLINEDDTMDYIFNILLNNPVSSFQIARLTAPSITAITGTAFAGATVNADGSFKMNILQSYNTVGKSLRVNMPAGSAAVITVQ